MKFTPEQKKLFHKNLKAQANPALEKELLKIKKPLYYKLKLGGGDCLNINLQDLRGNALLYKDVKAELEAGIKLYNEKYIYYPVLYYYGFGNGLLFKTLLQNPNLKTIFVFEPEFEILFILFHLVDFSQEFESTRLHILIPSLMDSENIYTLFSHFKQTYAFMSVYSLELCCDYYEKFNEQIIKLNQNISSTIRQIHLFRGNDTKDALIGLSYTTAHLIKLFTHPDLRQVAKDRNRFQNAIIVSTGPSLTKQLPLLKEYASKALICCADSSYSILHSAGIKPDIVFSIERVPTTSELFNNDFGDFDNGILFLIASLTHPNTLPYLEKNHRHYALVLRSLFYRFKFYNYIDMGQSVAHMAFDFAMRMGCKNILLIGQDLAYSEMGTSHPKDYFYGEHDYQDRAQNKDGSTATAYGGQGEVATSFVWNMFREYFQQIIPQAKINHNVDTYNCTEGGARIEGTIEMPFKEACERFLLQDKPKLRTPDNPSEKLSVEMMFSALALILKSFRQGNELIGFFEERSSILLQILDALNSNAQESKTLIQEAFKLIDEAKDKIEQISKVKKENHYTEILTPILYQFEFSLAKIYVYVPKNEQEVLNKSLAWIQKHAEHFALITGHIKMQMKTIDEASVNLTDELIKRGFEARMRNLQARIAAGKL